MTLVSLCPTKPANVPGTDATPAKLTNLTARFPRCPQLPRVPTSTLRTATSPQGPALAPPQAAPLPSTGPLSRCALACAEPLRLCACLLPPRAASASVLLTAWRRSVGGLPCSDDGYSGSGNAVCTADSGETTSAFVFAGCTGG